MRSVSAPAVAGQGSDASMRRRFTVFRPTNTEALRVSSALGGLKAVFRNSGAVAEVTGAISPRALAGVARGKVAA